MPAGFCLSAVLLHWQGRESCLGFLPGRGKFRCSVALRRRRGTERGNPPRDISRRPMTAPVLGTEECRGAPPGISALHVIKSLEHTHRGKNKRQAFRIQIKMYKTKQERTTKGNLKPHVSRTATEAATIYKVSVTQSLLVTCHGITAWNNSICVFTKIKLKSMWCGNSTDFFVVPVGIFRKAFSRLTCIMRLTNQMNNEKASKHCFSTVMQRMSKCIFSAHRSWTNSSLSLMEKKLKKTSLPSTLEILKAV